MIRKVLTPTIFAALVVMLGLLFGLSNLIVLQAQTTRILPAPTAVSFAFALGDQTNQQYLTVTIKDRLNNPLPFVPFTFYFSDQASGNGITATASSGTAGTLIGTGTGTVTAGVLLQVTAATPTVATSRVSMQLLTDSTGTAKIGVLDSAKTNFFPVVVLSNPRLLAVGAKLTTALYK